VENKEEYAGNKENHMYLLENTLGSNQAFSGIKQKFA
jgi:hypothetical protein